MFSEIPQRSSVPEYPADPWNPISAATGGSPVAVLWAENLWLHAIAATSNDEQCEILLEDGSKASVPRSSVVAIPNRAVFQAGHEVLARWRNPAMFPGTITAVSPLGYMVAWYDGSAPSSRATWGGHLPGMVSIGAASVFRQQCARRFSRIETARDPGA